jgi:hypothetical protein
MKAGKEWCSDASYAAVAAVIDRDFTALYPIGCSLRPPRKKPKKKLTPKASVARRNSQKTQR